MKTNYSKIVVSFCLPILVITYLLLYSQTYSQPMGGGSGPGGMGGASDVDPQTISKVREDAKKTQTTNKNIEDRFKVLRVLPPMLMQQGIPVGQYFPLTKFQEINGYMKSKDYDKAGPLIDEAFKNLDEASKNKGSGGAMQGGMQGRPPMGQGQGMQGRPPMGQMGSNGERGKLPSFAFASNVPIFCNITLNVNQGATINEMKSRMEIIRHHVTLLRKHGLKGDYWFTWLAVKQIMSIDPGFFDYLKQNGMGINHHGANRPPNPMPVNRVLGTSWNQDIQVMRDYESHDIDPSTGQLYMDKVGGLKGITESYHLQPFATGRFFKAQILAVAKEYGIKMGVGVKDNLGGPDSRSWYMGVLNRPDSITIIGDAISAWALTNGRDPRTHLTDELSSLNRREMNLMTIAMHDGDFYQNGNNVSEESIFEHFDLLLEWIEHNKDLKTVTCSDIYNMAVDDRNKLVTKSMLMELVQKDLADSSRTTPPLYYSQGSKDFLSLADMYQALCVSLSYYSKNGQLPNEVKIYDILGPTSNVSSSLDRLIPFTLSPKEVIDKSSQITQTIRATGVPAEIDTLTGRLNAAEFLRAMEQVYVKSNTMGSGSGTQWVVSLNSQSMIPKEISDYSNRDLLTQLQFWTYKPARWNISGLSGSGASAGKPILFWIYGHHYGGGYPETSMLRKFANLLNQYHLKGTFYTDGIYIDKIKKTDPDFFSFINKLGMPIGYHGEETHGPFPNAPGITNDKTWAQGVDAVIQRYTHKLKVNWLESSETNINMRESGASDLSQSGGIRAVEEAFGRDVDILTDHSLTSAPCGYAFMQLTRARVAQATMPLSYHAMMGYSPMKGDLEPVFSIGGINNHLFWYMNQLNTKEILEIGMLPPDKMKEQLNKLDRSHVNFATVLMEPDRPNGALTEFEERIRYIRDEFIPNNPGSQFVTPQDLLNLAEGPVPTSVSKEELSQITDNLLAHWDNRPPDYVTLPSGRSYSLVEVFEALMNSLSEFQKTQQLPESVSLSNYYGPIGEKDEYIHTSRTQIPIVDILNTAVRVKQNIPKSKYHNLPFQISVGQGNMNTAEFMNVMAKTYNQIYNHQSPSPVSIEQSEVIPPYGDILIKAFPANTTTVWYCQLQLWTVQPVRWKTF